MLDRYVTISSLQIGVKQETTDEKESNRQNKHRKQKSIVPGIAGNQDKDKEIHFN